MIGYPAQVPMDGLSDQYFQYFLWIDGTIDSGRELLLTSLLALAQQRPSHTTIYKQYGSHSIHILSVYQLTTQSFVQKFVFKRMLMIVADIVSACLKVADDMP